MNVTIELVGTIAGVAVPVALLVWWHASQMAKLRAEMNGIAEALRASLRQVERDVQKPLADLNALVNRMIGTIEAMKNAR